MFVQVRLLSGFRESLWYGVPPALHARCAVGSLVRVPLRNQSVSALIMQVSAHKPRVSFELREITDFERLPADARYVPYVHGLADYYQLESLRLIARVQHFLHQKEEKKKDTEIEHKESVHAAILLTDEQQAVCDFLIPQIKNGIYAPTVLHGVTGSGKTEVYKKIMQECLQEGKTCVLLLPEVTLALEFEQRLRHEMGESRPLVSFHSGTSIKKKRQLWQQLVDQKPVIVIGVHLPILLPIANLGLIIVDEEHEVGYQEKKHPKINSKEAALMRAHAYGVPILLGSATPSIATLHNVKTRGWHFFQLKKRFSGTFPKVQVALLTEQRERRNFWITQPLYLAIKKRLENKEQALIYINRRGFSFFVQCKQCTFVFSCTSCSVSLTLHGQDQLMCHYCGHTQSLPPTCQSCNAKGDALLKKGIGTQQVVSVLEKLFPTARIGRADLDTTTQKKVWHETMRAFRARELDILVGTQTITKGYDFPGITLVGIIWADLNLNLPMYNAAEATLQQLIQVSGRAGRHSQNSLVIMQTMADHAIFNYVNEVEYPAFYQKEIAERTMLNYPPHRRLAELELKHEKEAVLEADAQRVAQAIRVCLTHMKSTITVLGPAKPAVHMIKKMHARKLYLKGECMQEIAAVYAAVKSSVSLKSSLFFTPNPLT